MSVLISAFLLGTASGLRALIGLTVVSWAARLGYILLEHTWLAFLGFAFTPYILSLMAVGELVNDKLPKTPSRLIPPQFITRVVTGTLCGVAFGLATGHLLAGIVAGAAGSALGTFGGAKARGFGAELFGRDLPAEFDKAVAAIGGNVTAITGDIANLDDLDHIYKVIAGTKKKLDIVVANAGFAAMVSTVDVTPEHFDKMFNTNARGTFFTVQKALPLMNDGGSIVLIGSGTWEKGIPNYVAYSATKAALRSYVRTWTSELKDRKIRVNVISPGLIETPIIQAQMPSKEVADGARAYFTSITPLGRIGLPEEIAAAALFLASSESSYIAGINLPVDGGAVAV